MKKKQLIALGAIAVIFFTACSNPFFPEKKETNPGENGIIVGAAPETPVITLNVHPVNPYILGDEVTITANATVSDGGTLSYQWYSNDEESNEGGVLIPNETGASYEPSTNSAGTVYYYVKATNTLNGKTASAVSGAVKIIVYDIGTATAIRTVDVDVTAPIKDSTPAATVTTDDGGYTCSAVSWNPAHSPFQGGSAYTVTITLTAESNHTFTALRTASINGQTATVTANDGNALTLSYTFAPTDTRTVTGIAIASQPAKLTYTHNDTLDLNGLAVRLTFDTAETEDIALANFAARNISTQPANGVTLSHTDHNGQSVAVHYGEKTADTNNLTVNKVVVSSITFPTAGAITYGAALSTSALTGGAGVGSFAWANGAVIPTVANSGYDVEFTPDDAVNYDYSGVSGWNSETGKVTRTVSVTVNPASIINADVIVTSPVKGETPHTTATTEDTGYTCGAVSWSPDDNPFKGNTRYTATVTITAKENHVFASGLTAKINDIDAVTANNTGAAVTLSLEFDATLDKVVTGISIKTQPSKLTYTHGEALDLAGLVVTLAFDDSTSEDLTLAHFGTNISTHPANGAVLHRPTNNNQPVVVSFGELTAETGNLTVNAKALTVTGAAHTKPYDGTTAATGVSVTLGGIVGEDDVSAGTVTAVYTSAAAGTQTVNITDITLTGTAVGNYTVALPANNVNVTGGITKADPVVTSWPTAATITYGAALSTSVLTGGSGAGSFAWTSGSTIPTVANSGYQVTFTPTDAANYNTLTQNMAITVSKANPAVTWPTSTAITYGAALSTSALTGGSGAGIFAWTNGATIPTVTNSGYQVTFTPTDGANYNTLTQNVSITVNPASITAAAITVTTPAAGKLANTTASGTGNFSIGQVMWTPDDQTFMVGKAYTAAVTLTANENYAFAANQNLSATINGQNAAVTNNGSTVTLSYTFAVIADPNAGMNGATEATAFKVYDVETLNRVGKGTGSWIGNWFLSAYYEQIADIVLPPVGTGESNWTAIGNNSNQFTGTYDGGGYTISNLTINASSDYQGMFGYISNGSIVKNIGLNYINVSSDSSFRVGGVVGTNSGTVQNCYSTGNIKGTTNNANYNILYIGGVVGENSSSGTVQNCYSTVNVSSLYYQDYNLYVGGVAGTNSGTVQNCYSTGNVNGSTAGVLYVGGVVGINSGTLQRCYSRGNVGDNSNSNRGIYSGGVVGENSSSGTVQNCYSTGNVNGQIRNYINGGVVGINRGTVQNCYSTGGVGAGGAGGGGAGVGGAYSGTVQNCVALNNVGRVGLISSEFGSIPTILFYNNYKNMTQPTSNLNDEYGQAITSAQYNSESWWRNAGNWKTDDGAFAWDFVNVWQWNSATNLPILRNMPAGAQNHTVQ